MIECVLLDAGGVLLDLDFPYLRRLIKVRGIEIDLEQLALLEARARREVHEHVAAGGTTAERWSDYFRSILHAAGVREIDAQSSMIRSLAEAHERFGLWTTAFPGAVETVRKIHESGMPVGVVSNAEGRVEEDLHAAGFEGLLKCVVDSHVVGVAKPDPKIFHIALERMGAKAETTLFVGDVPAVDIEGARAAGLQAMLLDRHDLYPKIDVPRLRSITELSEYLSVPD